MINAQANADRALLAELRQGDYAHAGDKAAVELILAQMLSFHPEMKLSPCLDLGCGRGGTAQDLLNLGFSSVYGLDCDALTIEYAKSHYPSVHFQVGDALFVDSIFPAHFFGSIYMLNVAYALSDPYTCLPKKLFDIAKSGAMLAIFDYSQKTKSSPPLLDLAQISMHPIHVETLCSALIKAGWQIVLTVDLSLQFAEWYRTLLIQILNEPHKYLRLYPTFAPILQKLENQELGGVCIYAKKP